jgi:hypothetical protein
MCTLVLVSGKRGTKYNGSCVLLQIFLAKSEEPAYRMQASHRAFSQK